MNWIVHLKRRPDRSGGILILLLLVGIPFFLKMTFGGSENASYCDEAIYIQLEGDIPFPGVYPVQTRADGNMVFNQRIESFIQELFPLDANPCPIRSGMKWSIRQEGNEWQCLPGEMSAFYKHTLGIPIAINQESEEGLTAISGIGPQLAKAIIQERIRRGGFHHLDELRSVQGIGPGLLKRIAPVITF